MSSPRGYLAPRLPMRLSVISVCRAPMRLLVDATAQQLGPWAEALGMSWEHLVLEAGHRPYGEVLQRGIRTARGQWVLHLPPGSPLPELDQASLEEFAGPRALVGGSVWLVPRKCLVAIGGCHPLLAGERQVRLDLLGRLEAEGTRLLSMAELAMAGGGDTGPARGTFEYALLQAQQAADAAGDAALVVMYPWGVLRPQNADLSHLDPRLARKWRSLRRITFWRQLLDLPLQLMRMLPEAWLGSDQQGEFPVLAWHRRYWYWSRTLIRRCEALALGLLRLVG